MLETDLMRLAYFDCIAGISGDSALGALVDAGADRDELRAHLATLPLEPFELEFEEVDERGVRAIRAEVRTSGTSGVIRTYSSVRALLDASDLPPDAMHLAHRIFRRLAEAEARVPPPPPPRPLRPPLPRRPPRPRPGARVRRGPRRPPRPSCPTVEGYGEIPALRIEEAGYGAGAGRLDFPNVTRVLIGMEEPATSLPSVPGIPELRLVPEPREPGLRVPPRVRRLYRLDRGEAGLLRLWCPAGSPTLGPWVGARGS